MSTPKPAPRLTLKDPKTALAVKAWKKALREQKRKDIAGTEAAARALDK